MLIWVFLLFFFLLFLFLLFFTLRGLEWYTSYVDHLNLSQNLIWVSKKYYTKWECDRVNSDLRDLAWLRIAWQYSRLYGFPNFSLCNVSPLWGSYVSVLGFLLLSRVLQFVQTVKLIYRKQTPLGFWEELDIDGWISLFTHCYKRY